MKNEFQIQLSLSMFVNFTVTFLNRIAVLLFGIIHITCTYSLLFIGTPSKSTALTD